MVSPIGTSAAAVGPPAHPSAVRRPGEAVLAWLMTQAPPSVKSVVWGRAGADGSTRCFFPGRSYVAVCKDADLLQNTRRTS